jgi:hypothetical protein
MVADFVSADFGWLVGPKTGRTARVILKPGKNRDVSDKIVQLLFLDLCLQAYFTNDDILGQARTAMEILLEFGNNIEHVFVYDNATTHKKRAEDALSARKMPKTTPTPYKSGKNAGRQRPNPLVERTVRSTDGNPSSIPTAQFGRRKSQWQAHHSTTVNPSHFTSSRELKLGCSRACRLSLRSEDIL